MSTRRQSVVLISVLTMMAVSVTVAPPAHATTYELLENRSFDGSPSNREWELCDPATDLPPSGANGGPVACAADGAISTGAWTVNSIEAATKSGSSCSFNGSANSAALQPDVDENVAIRQRMITGLLVGRNLTISGCWRRSTSPENADRKLKLTLFWKKDRGTSEDPGTYDSSCTWTAEDSETSWTYFSFSPSECNMPGTSGTKMLSDSYLQVETVGTKGNVRVDELSVSTTNDASAWNISCSGTLVNCRSETMPSSISTSMEIAAVSHRYDVTGDDGFPVREIVVTDADGENVTRVTTQPTPKYGQIHPAVSPDRTLVAVVRFTDDWNDDEKYTTTIDPQSLWILNLSAGKAFQLTPYWQDGALAGVAWGTDSDTIYYSTEIGRYTRIYEVVLSTGAVTLMSDFSVNDWESDVDLSRDGTQLIFHASERLVDGTYEEKGRIWIQDISDGPCGPCTSREQITDIDLEPQDSPDGSRLGVGDYDPQFSPDGMEILFWRNRPCSTSCATQGWSIETCDITDCESDSDLTQLVDGGVGDVTQTGGPDLVFLIPDWADPDNVPNGTLPIIVGNADIREDNEFFGIYAMESDGTGDTKLNQVNNPDDCTGFSAGALYEPEECEVWPRWIDR